MPILYRPEGPDPHKCSYRLPNPDSFPFKTIASCDKCGTIFILQTYGGHYWHKLTFQKHAKKKYAK